MLTHVSCYAVSKLFLSLLALLLLLFDFLSNTDLRLILHLVVEFQFKKFERTPFDLKIKPINFACKVSTTEQIYLLIDSCAVEFVILVK